jgi:hypothetical protein
MNDSENSIRRQLRIMVEQGIAAALDPVNDVAIQSGGRATTTLNSFWLHHRCSTCNHTFRLGDQVEVRGDGQVLHCSPLLPCAGGREVEVTSGPETAAFFFGLDEEWPPPEGIPIVRLEVGHPLLAPRFRRLERHTCSVCGHTFRLHDQVVICPCSPHRPLCQAAIHRDPIHGLYCLDAWNPDANEQKYCPITSRQLGK